MSGSKKSWSGKLWLPVTIVLLVLINWLASLYHTRIDFTNERRFTLSTPTKKILKSLDETVQVDVFLKGDLPSGFKKLANSSNEILSEFKEVAGNKFQFNFISPDDVAAGSATPWGDRLTAAGLTPINIKAQIKSGEQQQYVYPVALVHYKTDTLPVVLFEAKGISGPNADGRISYAELNSAEALMEFRFADAIYKLTHPEKPLIAYSIGNGEPGDYRSYDLANNVLQKEFDLKTFNLNTQPVIPDTFKLVIIVKPTLKFTDMEKLKLDQFVMHGGKLLLFIDKLDAELDSLKSMSNQVVAYDRGLNLDDLLFKYGVRINPDLVMDLQCDFLPFVTNGSAQMEYLHWNYFPLFETKSNHVINKNLGLVSGQFVNSVDTVEADGIKKTVLLSSSSNARIISTPALISGKENVNAPEDDKFKKANIPVAVLLEGKFQSMFTNRLPQAMNDSLKTVGGIFQQQCLRDNKIIVVGDGDMVLNAIDKDGPMPMGVNRYTAGTQYNYQFANRDFVQNCLDYLVNSSGLEEAKAKDYTLRLLDSKKVTSGKTTWQLINIAVPVLIVFLFAVLYQWRRRTKYTK
ncbi:MAG: gliding motility-associated ABC transporter substrate-binding protein GldG [Bacteroidetes bacterium]|nr:gliding motility-associated ABC transporter substrate-binding protein GldG [Bacteroidota bacterium]